MLEKDFVMLQAPPRSASSCAKTSHLNVCVGDVPWIGFCRLTRRGQSWNLFRVHSGFSNHHLAKALPKPAKALPKPCQSLPNHAKDCQSIAKSCQSLPKPAKALPKHCQSLGSTCDAPRNAVASLHRRIRRQHLECRRHFRTYTRRQGAPEGRAHCRANGTVWVPLYPGSSVGCRYPCGMQDVRLAGVPCCRTRRDKDHGCRARCTARRASPEVLRGMRKQPMHRS